MDAGGPERLDGDARDDRAVAADGLAHPLEQLQPEPGPVCQGAPVFIGALVVEGGEELHR